MFKYYESRPEVPLYDPAVMREFCEKNAPGLFDLLLKSITRDDNRVLPNREFIFIFQLDCFMINLLDDYHNIHSKHVPTDLQKTKIAHMASSMLDIHPHIPAIKRTIVSPHRQVKVNIRGENKMCLGGADSSAVLLHINRGLKDMRNHFIDQLPAQMKNLNPGNFHNLVQNFR